MKPLRVLLPVLVLFVSVRYPWASKLVLHGVGTLCVRLLQFTVLLVGSGSFWWALRSYQLQKEQELLDQALLKFKYYSRYRARLGSNSQGAGGPRSCSGELAALNGSAGACMTDAGFQLRVLKRLPIVAHLRTSWSLPQELCDEIAALIQLIVRDYVSYWFQAISPSEEFPNDVRFLLADLLGAVASRVLEIDSSQALTMVAKSLELLRLHLGWFREAYAQLADDYPNIFEGDENDSNLLKRQEYVAAFFQRSQFIHPGVVAVAPTVMFPATGGNGKKSVGESAEAAYLRHVATQLLTQLRPQLGQQCDTNMFVSVALNLLREITAFKILKPLTEYAEPRYANEIVLSCLQAFVDEKDPPPGGNAGMLPTLSLNKLRTTSSFLYKASKRSGEQAEAAFQAVVDAVASAASSAAAGAAEMVFEGDEWTDSGSNPFAFGSAVFSANAGGAAGEKKGMPSIFTMDDRVAKAAKMMKPRIPGSLLTHKMTGENSRISAHMDDLKNAKANIGSSLNSSLGKVRRRLKTLSSHQMDPISTPPLSTGAAARMIRKPGQLLQKAWKRGESGVTSPTSSFDDGAVTPTSERGRSNAHTMGSLNPLLSPMSDDEDDLTPRMASGSLKMVAVRERVVQHLEKAVVNYAKMYDECPEMRSSSRSRELYELLLAIEDVFMLGFRNQDSKTPSSEEDNGDGTYTPPLSPNVRRRSSLPLPKADISSLRRESLGTDRGSESDEEVDDDQYYWAYLARERSGAADLNAHWRFVASHCPTCGPSESFVSTRGVQWTLVALEKGQMGTFFAELHAHQDATNLFYESYALMHDRSLMESTLRTLSQLDTLKVCLDVPVLLGKKSDREATASSSDQWRSRDVLSPSAPVRVLERVWETERYVPMNGWIKANDKRWEELPSSEWIWEDEWALENGGNDTGDSSDGEAQTLGWEYAKTFEDHFHDKEKKFDSVRRRRWIRRRRQLSPVLALASPPVSPVGFNVSSPQSSATVPAGFGKARKLKQRFNALKLDRNKDKASATKKTMLKRRSKSFDKDTPDSPITDATLELIDSDDAHRTSSRTSAFMKARASIPSLRRGISNRSSKSNAPDAQVKDPMDDVDAVYDNDADDDDNLCFRCLKALPASKAGVAVCQSCHQRVCASCHEFFAFVAFPPPLEASKKARVCGNCYDRLVSKYKLRIEAHVGKYLIKDRERELPELFSSASASSTAGSGSTSGGQGVASPTHNGHSSGSAGDSTSPGTITSPSAVRASGHTKFEITVKIKDDNAYAWSVIKTFHDFEVLEKELTEKLKKQEKKFGVGCQACHWRGVDYMEMTAIKPSLKTVAAATLTYEQRLHVLEQFLQQLLSCDTLCQSSVVQKFLLLANAYGSSLTATSPQPGWDGSETPVSPSAISSSGAGATSTASGGSGSTGGVLVENGKWRKGRWIAPDANSKETKMRVLQKIEVSLFSVLGELFEFDGIGLVRRQIFSMTRSFIKAFLGASHFRMLERQFLSFTDPKKLSGWIGDLRLYIFPDPSAAAAAPPPAPDLQELRKDCLEAILASFPSKALSLFGDTSCENAALKLHEFLQHEVFVKNLLFSITDELLLHLFPDSTTFQGKKATPATPTAATAVSKRVASPPADDNCPAPLAPGTPSSSPPRSAAAAQKNAKVVI